MNFNVGYSEAMKTSDFNCLVFHDVDLLPEDDRILYTCSSQPRHLSVAIDKFKYVLPYKGSDARKEPLKQCSICIFQKYSAVRLPCARLNSEKWTGSQISTGAGAGRMTTCRNVSRRVKWKYCDTKKIYRGELCLCIYLEIHLHMIDIMIDRKYMMLADIRWSNIRTKKQTLLTLNVSTCWKKLRSFRKQMVLTISSRY